MIDTVYIGSHKFSTLVAISQQEQARGLMGQEWPPPVMCFPYKRADYRKFWMKNTPSPLDIIFVKSNVVVDILKGEPHSTTTVGPNVPCDLVVELPFGTVSQLNISVGDVVKTCFSIDTMSRFLKESSCG